MIRWEWEGNGNKKVIPAHLYGAVPYAQVSYKTVDSVANANKTTVTNKPYTM